ncbi:type VI secretion system Vgr family protein, partial [Janthinobacterium sp. CG3]|uniref:type VI secretion system Vgr family protein n=1 Tax=Janthinobacterium sp. CG3 TaxID=1075768 RepID=UPI001E3FCD9C
MALHGRLKAHLAGRARRCGATPRRTAATTHLRHQSDNQRLAKAGFGAELKTEHAAALRAGQGMLLS